MRTFFFITSLVASCVWAGVGTYTPGSPDKLKLHVMFMYDEQNPADWEPMLKEASKLLYDATEKQVSISEVIFYSNCPDAEDKMDIKIYDDTNGANAHAGGFGQSGLRVRLSQTHKSATTSGNGNRGQFGLAHELGHYVFAVLDEYLDKSGQRTNMAFCIDNGGTTASVMDGGTTVSPANQRTEFCISADHRAGETKQCAKRSIGGTEYEDTSCWDFLAAYALNKYSATLSVPTKAPSSDTGGHIDPTFNSVECSVRAVVCIDRSGSMASRVQQRSLDGAPAFENTELYLNVGAGLAPIDLAKQGGRNFINLLGETENAAVTSFSSNASVNFAMALMTTANKNAARAAIAAIQATGSTNIGGGLQVSLDQITGEGDAVSNEVIILLSDGLHNTGTSPSSVLPSLKQRGVIVHTIGLGNVDAQLMSQIANETGGSYLFASSSSQLNSHFLSLLAAARSKDVVSELSEELQALGSRTFNSYVDSLSAVGEVDFILTWEQVGAEFDFILRNPNNVVISPDSPGVSFEYDEENGAKYYKVTQPLVGGWTIEVQNPINQNIQFTYQTQSDSIDTVLVGESDKLIYTYPEPILLQARVLQDSSITGAKVSAIVTRPNSGPPVTIALFDDGEEAHNDLFAGDGIYGAIFNRFYGSGNYTFKIMADTEGGITAAENEDGAPFVSEPVVRFTRETSFSVIVEGGDTIDTDLDGILDQEEDGAPNNGDGNNDGIFDREQSDVASLSRLDGGYATLDGSGCILQNVSAGFPSPSLPVGDFPFGVFSFDALCDNADITITLHDATPTGLSVLSYGYPQSTLPPHWFSLPASGPTSALIFGDTLEISLQDSGPADFDRSNNGRIVVNQIGLANGSGVQPIPTLGEFALLAFIGLLLGTAIYFGRKGAKSHAKHF